MRAILSAILLCFSACLAADVKPRPSVVRVTCATAKEESVGSGVVVDDDIVVTNWHVVRDRHDRLTVRCATGGEFPARVVDHDETWDLAALSAPNIDVEPAEIAADTPAIGDRLTIAGYGAGPYLEQSGPVIEYLSPGRSAGSPYLLGVRCVARQGDSGGPMFDASGRVAGVLFGSNPQMTVGPSAPRIRSFVERAKSR